MNSLLLVEDDAAVRFGVRRFLAGRNIDVQEADTIEAALRSLEANPPHWIVSDFSLPDGDALRLLERVRALEEAIPFIILTGHATVDLAVRAMQAGADHFLTKPVDLPSLATILDRLHSARRSRQKEAAAVRSRPAAEQDPFAGPGPASQRLRVEAESALQGQGPILLLGETGSGKGVLARWLHEQSSRGEEPFVDLNCAGLTPEFLESELFGHEKGAFTGAVAAKPGLLEVAQHGTLFLDEIGDIDLRVQAKLLKVIEDRRFRRLGSVREKVADVRLIFATHHPLQTRAAEGAFRQDLFYRISAFPIALPPLRQRAEDIPFLAEKIVAALAPGLSRSPPTLTSAALEKLKRYDWPGNIRELRNVLERALLRVQGTVVDVEALVLPSAATPPVTSPHQGPRLATLAEIEREHFTSVFRHTGENVQLTAEILGISRSSAYNKLKQFGLKES